MTSSERNMGLFTDFSGSMFPSTGILPPPFRSSFPQRFDLSPSSTPDRNDPCGNQTVFFQNDSSAFFGNNLDNGDFDDDFDDDFDEDFEEDFEDLPDDELNEFDYPDEDGDCEETSDDDFEENFDDFDDMNSDENTFDSEEENE